MTFYLLLLFSVIAGVFAIDKVKSEQNKKRLTLVYFIGLTLISGTRFELGGSDYYIYRKAFNVIPDIFHLANIQTAAIGGTNLVDMFESGYLVFNSLSKTMGFSFYGFILIESIIWYVCMYIGLNRYVENWGLLFLVFLYKLFFYNTFISLRQSITIALFFLAWRFLQERKLIIYYAICCFALLFHNGALILFVLYPIFAFRINKKRFMLGAVICSAYYALTFFGVSVFTLAEKILSEISGQSVLVIKIHEWLSIHSGISPFHVLEYLLILLLVIINYEKIMKYSPHAEFILKLFFILLPILTVLGENIVATRFKDYFTITYGVILCYLCGIHKGRLKLLVQAGTVVVCAYGYIRYLRNFDSGGLLPYVSYLTKGISIFQ